MCRALAVNYKKFSSGAPDLLLLRVSRPRTQDSMSPPECLDLEKILGPSWVSLGDFEESLPGDAAKAKDSESSSKLENDTDDVIGILPLRPEGEKAVYKGRGRNSRWRKRKGADNDDLSSLQQVKEVQSTSVTRYEAPDNIKRNSSEIQSKSEMEDRNSVDIDSDDDTNGEDSSFLEREEDHSPTVGTSPRGDTDTEVTSASMEIDDEGRETASSPLPKLTDGEHYRFTTNEPDLILPVHSSHCATDTDTHCASGIRGSEGEGASRTAEQSRCHGGWRYECLMLEVKGPTDTLADHQLMWLRMIQRSGVTALVGHVKETESTEE